MHNDLINSDKLKSRKSDNKAAPHYQTVGKETGNRAPSGRRGRAPRELIAPQSAPSSHASIKPPQVSRMSHGTENHKICRICHDSSESLNSTESNSLGRLIAPCLCDGSMKYVHEKCIQRWIEISKSRKCELCHAELELHRHAKLEKEMTDEEQKRESKAQHRSIPMVDPHSTVPRAPVLLTPITNPSKAAPPIHTAGPSARSQSNAHEVTCRICKGSTDSANDGELDWCGPLIAPCLCDGTAKYVHERCIQQWVEENRSKRCTNCGFEYTTKRVIQWKRCLVASGHLSVLVTFELTMLLLTVVAIWWFVAASTCYRFSPIWHLVMTVLVLYFLLIFVVWLVFACRYVEDWWQFGYKYVVQDTTNERMAESRRDAMA